MSKTHGLQTQAIHAGYGPEPGCQAVAVPIYQTSTFGFESAAQSARCFSGEEDGYTYTRYGNPTIKVFEDKLACMEGAEAAQAVASGMAAISTALLGLAKAGDHVLSSDAVYIGTHLMLTETMPELGIECSYVDASNVDNVAAAIRPNTKVIYLETPGNPSLKLVDLAAVAALARERGILTIVDNTFASPINQRPLQLGCDVVVHSATKYLNGHGDCIGGGICGSEELIKKLWHKYIQFGGTLAPLNAFLIARGMQTLPLRMRAHNQIAQQVAEFLEQHSAVERVYYPGLPSFPQYELAKKQMTGGFGAMVCFELRGGIEAGARLMDNVKLCTIAVSLGDVVTLISHPASMTHAMAPREDRLKAGITDGLVRLSVGLEDVEDIIEDLDQAMRS
ncbi:MAG: aminotransferase class I/II-fold pyridoxal phosphate-dependent enzyme [Armatimonadia bacterium]